MNRIRLLCLVPFLTFCLSSNAQTLQQLNAVLDQHKPFREIVAEADALLSNSTFLRDAEEEEDNERFEEITTQYGRWKWYHQNRLDSVGYPVNVSMLSLLAVEKERKQVTNQRNLPEGDWNCVGPTDFWTNIPSTQLGMGRVNCIAFDNTNSFIYAGSASGGAWRKGLSGGSWECITNNIPNLSVSSICVNPLNPATIYLLTGDGDGNSNSSFGVIVSYDFGASWYRSGLQWNIPTFVAAYKMLMHPTNPSVLFVASSEGISKSTNGGATWSTVQSGRFYDIEFKPGAPATMYASGRGTFYKSTNTGDTWTPVTIPGFAFTGNERTGIAVSSAAPAKVYFISGTVSLPGFNGLWVSTNSGTSWGTGPVSSASTTKDVFIDGTNAYSQANYDNCIAANPANANEIFVGGIDVYRSTNGGVSFARESSYYQAGNDNMHPDQHCIEYDGSGTMWVGNDAGVHKYDPGNITAKWSMQFSGMTTTQYYGVGLDRDANIFGNYEANYMGAQDNGEHRYDGDANNEIVYFGDGGDAVVDPTNDNTYYFNGNGKLMKSCWPTPCDKTPPTATCGCTTDVNYNKSLALTPDRPIVINPTNHNIIYHGISCLWVSNDGADNWSLYPGFPCDSGGAVTGVQVGASYKWVSKSYKVYREITTGVWSDVTSNLSLLFTLGATSITDIAVNPVNGLEAWVTFAGYIQGVKVFHTSDGGSSWVDWGQNLPNVPVKCIIYQNGTNVGVYVGTDIGVYYTNNLLPNFVPFKNGMPSVIITDLDINPGQGLLYATTYGRGMWVSHLAGACPADDATSNFASLPGSSIIQASNSVTSSQQFLNGYGQAITLQAGNFVRLDPGFESGNGTVVTASIASCSTVAGHVDTYNNGRLLLDASVIQPGETTPALTEQSSTLNLVLQPNPVHNILTLSMSLVQSGPLELQILDITGRLLMQINTPSEVKEGSYRIPVEVSSLPSGSYIIRASIGESSEVKRFVKY